MSALLTVRGLLSHELNPMMAAGLMRTLNVLLGWYAALFPVILVQQWREGDPAAAIGAYKKAGAPPAKVIQCYAELGDIDEVCLLSKELSPPQLGLPNPNPQLTTLTLTR